MHLVDHIFVFLLFVAQPVYGFFEARRHAAWAEAGRATDRVCFYRHTMGLEWSFLAVLGAAWITLRRPVEDLGFVSPGGAGFWIGLVLLIIMIGVLLHSWRSARKATGAETALQTGYARKIVQFIPQSALELRNFVGVSITAGIVEEIVYRGFVLWYLVQFMPLWAAVIVSSVAFGLGHGYQGANGAMRAGLVGFAFALFYVGTGSIWLPIVAHALLDILQGVALYELLRRRNDELKPAFEQ
jgi:membrane protease YdiL (CAAX protease family)